jgi:hypothetical protein
MAMKTKAVWEACGGMLAVGGGKKRNGKPHTVLMIQVFVCMTEADAKRVSKQHSSLKFVKRTRRELPAAKGGCA